MTFADITAEVQGALARTDSEVTTLVPGWVNRRQREAAKRHNFAFMRTTGAAIPTVVDQQSYALPADFKDALVFYLLTSSAYVPLEVRGTLEMLRRFSPTDGGEPAFLTLEPGTGTVQVWPPKPDAVYAIIPVYFAWPADLAGTQTNWLTINAPKMLVAGGVAEGLAYLGSDEEAAVWDQRFWAEWKAAKDHDLGRALASAFTLVPRWDSTSGETARQRAGWP
jgi:hypothetical protein